MPPLKDLTGQRFGRLVAIERAGSTPKREASWLCQCDCGRVVIVPSYNLRSGNTKSCGCFNSAESKRRFTTHGKSTCRLHRVWDNMKQRCYNPSNARYHQYGGRGITICDAWRFDFQSFYDWAMSHGYDENAPKGKCTIDRIDNDKGYSPDNCRWVDMKVQRHNRSDSRSKQL